MTIKPGDRLPSMALKQWIDGSMKEIKTDDLFGKGKVVLFGVPGAFTPTCSIKHLPGYVEKEPSLKAKGVDRIVCVSVNDPFVMDAWFKQSNVGDKVVMLPDGNGDFIRALGLEMDAKSNQLGVRSQRFSMLIQDGVVKALHIEKPGTFEASSADEMLKRV